MVQDRVFYSDWFRVGTGWIGLGLDSFTYLSGKGSSNDFRLSFRLIRTVTMMMSSSVGGLAGSRSKITPALRKPPTERVRTGWRAGTWLLLFGFEARRVSSTAAGMVVSFFGVREVVVVVEARRGEVVAGMYGAYAQAYETARWLEIVSIGESGD